jgi:hypothetical protein
MVLCTTIGIGKELYDKHTDGAFSGRDVVADLVGCSLGVVLFNGTSDSVSFDGTTIQWKILF